MAISESSACSLGAKLRLIPQPFSPPQLQAPAGTRLTSSCVSLHGAQVLGLGRRHPLPQASSLSSTAVSGSESLSASETPRNTVNMLRGTYKVGSRRQKVNIFLSDGCHSCYGYLLQEALQVPHEEAEINKLL